jgi:CheY-specific phosphatase CheX
LTSGIQFFGEFLIERWVITREQLLEALELQEYRNLKFGNLAVRKGYLTEDQVRAINEYQRKEDMRFGDIAIMLGVLSPDQVQEIITYQKNNYLYVGEALLELGHVTEDVMDRELTIFREEQTPYGLDDVTVPGGMLGEEVVQISVDLTSKMFLRMIGMGLKIGLGQYNIDGHKDALEYNISVSMPMHGKVPVDYILSLSSDVATLIASNLLGEDATVEGLDVIEDSVKEFCNVVCGNVVAKLAKRGIKMSLGLPKTLTTVPVSADGFSVLVFPVHLSEGAMDLRFLIPNA